MRRLVAAPAALLLIILTAGIVLAFTWQTGTTNVDPEAQLRSKINAAHYRACGRYLTHDLRLRTAARYKSVDMAYHGYFAHAYPDGRRTWDFYPRAGIGYSRAAEILAWNTYPDNDAAKGAFSQFMGSTSHRGVILSCTYTRFGAGAFKAANGKRYFSVEFVRP